MRLSDFGAEIRRVTTMPSRADKVEALVGVLQSVEAETREDAIALMTRVLPVAGSRDDFARHWPPDGVAAATAASLELADVTRALRRAEAQADQGDDLELLGLLVAATSDEQELLRSFRIGSAARFGQPAALVSAIARVTGASVGDVRRAGSILGSLAEAASVGLVDGPGALRATGVEPGRPVRPMLASPVDGAVHDLDESERFVVEARHSGTRIQAHRSGAVVDLFDRSLARVNDVYPHVVAVVSGLARGDLVLDGVVVDDPSQTDRPSDVLFFDILYDGESLLDVPFADRRNRLGSLVPAVHRVRSAASNEAVVDEMLRDESHDGVILKDLATPYDCGRASSAWRWVRRMFDLDLHVVAAEWGTGSRSDYLSVVHVAAIGDDGRPAVVGKISRGIPTDLLDWQTARFGELATEPRSVGADADADVHLRPEIVAHVRCAGCELSDRFPSGVALRSPRLVAYGDVGSTPTVATLDEVRRLRLDSSGSGTTAPPPTLPDRVMPQRASPSDELHASFPALVPELPVAMTDQHTVDLVDQLEYEPYEAPVLIGTSVAERAVMGARVVAFLWSSALAIAAIALPRTDLVGDGGAVSVIAPFGIVVAAALTLSGWWWSDRAVRDLQRLDGRRPTRVRCATAWLAPLIVGILLQVTVVRAEPSETFDIRPLIVGTAVAAVLWRPYSLIRRILATLIRVRSDAVLAVGFLIDTAAVGMTWWRLTATDASATPGEIDALVGTLQAVAFVQAAGFVAWYYIVRSVRGALDHRAASQQTRYEHRMLRLRGVDPTDPQVWWGLVRRRASAAETAASRTAGGDATGRPTSLSVDEMVEEARAANVRALRRLGSERSEELLDQLRERFSTALVEINEPPSDEQVAIATHTDESPAPASAEIDVPVDNGVATTIARAMPVDEMPVDEMPVDEMLVDDDLERASEIASDHSAVAAGDTTSDAAEAETAVEPVDAEVDAEIADDHVAAEARELSSGDVESESQTTADEQMPADDSALSPLAQLMREARTGQVAPEVPSGDIDSESQTTVDKKTPADEQMPADDSALSPLAQLMREARTGQVAPEVPSGDIDSESQTTVDKKTPADEQTPADDSALSPLAQLMREARTVQFESTLAEHRRRDVEQQPRGERMVPPRLVALEAARFLVVLGLGSVTIAAGWMAQRALGADTFLNRLTPEGAADLERARHVFVAVFLGVVVLVPLWSWVVSIYAQRAGMPMTRRRLQLILFVLVMVVAGAASVAHSGDRAGLTVVLGFPAALLAAASAALVDPVRHWFELRSGTLVLGALSLPASLTIAALTGLMSPVETTSSLQLLGFSTIVLALVSALTAVFFALSSVDLEDEIKLSPSMAVSARSIRRDQV